MSWIVEEAKKCSPYNNRVILENPEAVKELDELLLHSYYPFLKAELEKTGYRYIPVHQDDIQIDSAWNGGVNFGRSMIFMLFDDLDYSFFRGTITCSDTGFFLEKEFFLGLPEDTDPVFLFRILSEERFAGNPPDLHIEQSSPIYPEWNTYFHITLHAGNGFETGDWTLHNAAKGNIETAIHDSVEMFENSMIEGFSSIDDVEDFLKAAYRCFDAY
jgi:hypothetical protein